MSAPVPAPRSNPGGKRPIPAPRTLVPVRIEEESNENETNTNPAVQSTEGKNTFRRKVQTISNDIGGRVNEGKKAVIESTRQSVRKITRRFTNNFTEPSEDAKTETNEVESLDVFNISFDSPIRSSDTESVYSNVTNNNNGNNKRVQRSVIPAAFEDDDDDSPPPPYPPPALPDDTYDVPSVASGETTSSEETRGRSRGHVNYESVFPTYPYNSDSDSCVDMTAAQKDRPKEEPTYNNVDGTPTMSTTSTSERTSFIRANSLYENCDIMPIVRSPPTKSVLIEFDPLSNEAGGMTLAEELSELEKALQGDLHGSFNLDNLSIFDDMSETDETYISPPPPPPPERSDSLFDNDQASAPSSPKPELRSKINKEIGGSTSKTSWYLGNQSNQSKESAGAALETKTTESISQMLMKRIKPLVNKAESLKNQFSKKDNVVARPMIQIKRGIQQKGMLFRITKGPVDELFGELNARWCVLQPGALLCHADNSCDTIKENISIESILSIQIVQDQKMKYKHDEGEIFCFELNVAGKLRVKYVFGTKSKSERRVWMQNLAENMCYRFGSRVTSDYKRIGWCYYKAGVNGQWKGVWICLARRKLYYLQDTTLKHFDLRKARCFKLEPYVPETSPSTSDKGPNIVIHFTTETYYFRMWTQRETKVWCHIIKLAASDNGPNLNQQQLTKDDVPVIVAKCINFLYVYGSMTEGIYRKAGSNTTVSELMNKFRTDAWSVQLTDKYSSHDVANVLKRFFRELAEPLIDNSKRQYLYQVSLVKNEDERVRMYKAMFDQFDKITFNTCRKLLSHLHFISTQSNKNMMTVLNLAAIWGPTLLHDSIEEGNKARVIIMQLIELSKHIFPEDLVEREKENKMLNVLKKYSNSPQGPVNVKSAGDFRVWVYLYNKDGKDFNIAVGPNKTAYDILCELSGQVNLLVHELVLEELVLNDNLTRPIHHSEKVLDVVMKWGFWKDSDCKDNCLILNNISKYWEYLNDNNEPLSAELKYADNKTRSLKSYKFEFQQAKLTYYKERQTNNMLGQWNIEDIFIYFGSEPKRNSPFAITFFPRSEYPVRNKMHMYFGHVIAFPDPTMKARWISTMWRAEHHSNLTPPPQHVNLMSS
ncbi:arf-GAP with Rho-GAP domain, ANK repeat and PH domain-containing protein 2 isoform X2 [Atheta coriaria]|uniref:arf-GAP with Rho-GAP domain, ANK repeat and PH domain-containing protein 2 isoform X2 n=1 Tax=Dalotia coriaria TaxID=877792 RepID=UPI0031F409E8